MWVDKIEYMDEIYIITLPESLKGEGYPTVESEQVSGDEDFSEKFTPNSL